MRLTNAKKIKRFLWTNVKPNELLGLLEEAYLSSNNKKEIGYGVVLDTYSGELSVRKNDIVVNKSIFLCQIKGTNSFSDLFKERFKNDTNQLQTYSNYLSLSDDEIPPQILGSMKQDFSNGFHSLQKKDYVKLLQELSDFGEEYQMQYYKKYQKIKYFRLLTGKSQADIAKEINVCTQQINDWENLRKTPNSKHIILLAEVFQVDTKELHQDF